MVGALAVVRMLNPFPHPSASRRRNLKGEGDIDNAAVAGC